MSLELHEHADIHHSCSFLFFLMVFSMLNHPAIGVSPKFSTPLGDANPLIPRWPIGSQGWCDGAETDEEIVGHSVGKARLELWLK